MNRKYLSGYRFERKVKALLEEEGFTVFRLAGSKPIDLIAIRDGFVLLIECRKNMKNITEDSLKKLRELEQETEVKVVLAFSKKRKIFLLDPVHGETVNMTDHVFC